MVKQLLSRFRGARAQAMFFAGVMTAMVSGAASAAGASPVDSIVNGVCKFMGPFVGQSKILSLILLLSLGVMLVLWFLNENKEGVIVWLLRVGVCIGILINIFSIPPLFGLPGIC